MADPYNRLAMFSAPVAPDGVVNHLAPAQLPAGHPSNMLMAVRDWIPAVEADDSSLTSGIVSRLGRTATGIPRAGLETMSNWLRGTHDLDAVRVGPDTIAPLGAAGMVGLAGRAMMMNPANVNARGSVAVMSDSSRSSAPGTVVNAMAPRELVQDYVRRLNESLPDADGFPALMREIEADPRISQSEAVQIASEFFHRIPNSTSRGKALRHAAARHERLMESRQASSTIGRPNKVFADGARSSVPGTVVNAMGEARTGTSPGGGHPSGYAAPTPQPSPHQAGQPGHTPASSSGPQGPGSHSSMRSGQSLGAFDASEIRRAYETRSDLPDGWYVHGRHGREALRDDAVIQATRSYDTMEQYAGKDGSGWAIRPKDDAKVLDLTAGSPEIRKIAQQMMADYRAGRLPHDMDEMMPPNPTVADFHRSALEFSPNRIVESAQAFDSVPMVNWLYDRRSPDFVRTPDGAVAMHPDAVHKVRLFADNAKGSVPGTVVNSMADPEMPAHLKKMQRQNQYADAKLKRAEEKKAAWAARRGEEYPAPPPLPDSRAGHLMAGPNGIYVNDGTAGWRVTDRPSIENARDGIRPAAQIGVKYPGAGRAANDLRSSPLASAPGLAANSTQQEDDGVLSILRKYGLLE